MLVYFTILAIATVLAVFLVLPALTICSISSWALVVVALSFICPGLSLGRKEKLGNIFSTCALILAAIMPIAGFVASPLFMSHSYASILGIPEKTDMEEYTPSIETVPLMDRGTAELLMNRTLGTLVDEVLSFIESEYDLNKSQAQAVFSLAYEQGHSAGFEEVLTHVQSFGSFASDIIRML